MKQKTNSQLKILAATALKSEYGFSPSSTKIVLLEANGIGTYILFRVGGHVYRFESRIMQIGDMETVWSGAGTIEKMD